MVHHVFGSQITPVAMYIQIHVFLSCYVTFIIKLILMMIDVILTAKKGITKRYLFFYSRDDKKHFGDSN